MKLRAQLYSEVLSVTVLSMRAVWVWAKGSRKKLLGTQQ